MRATAQTFNGSNTYRYLKKPAYVGQLRLKGWAYVVPPKSAGDPEWVKRAAEFWQLQAETFGLRFDDNILISVDYASGVVVSAVHVAEILPGKRTTNYVTPRVAEQRVLDQLAATDEPS